MKKLIVLAMCAVSTLGYSKDLSPKKELLADIKAETKKCAVQVVDANSENENGKVIGFKSVCSSLVITSDSEANIQIDGEWLVAKIAESKESDGGDLDDLTIINSKGKVIATKTNIPAYDNIIVAMAGDSDFSEKEELKK
jgi:hypothetical protein